MAGIDKVSLERFKKGELKFTQLFQISASQIAAILVSGHNFFTKGRLAEARQIFEGLSVVDPNQPYVQTMLGAIYQQMEQYDRAICHYTAALKLNPGDINALTNRAEIYLKVGQFSEAASDLKKSIELDPDKKHPAAIRARLLSLMAAETLHKIKQGRGIS